MASNNLHIVEQESINQSVILRQFANTQLYPIDPDPNNGILNPISPNIPDVITNYTNIGVSLYPFIDDTPITVNQPFINQTFLSGGLNKRTVKKWTGIEWKIVRTI